MIFFFLDPRDHEEGRFREGSGLDTDRCPGEVTTCGGSIFDLCLVCLTAWIDYVNFCRRDWYDR